MKKLKKLFVGLSLMLAFVLMSFTSLKVNALSKQVQDMLFEKLTNAIDTQMARYSLDTRIEKYRSIKNLLENYLKHPKRQDIVGLVKMLVSYIDTKLYELETQQQKTEGISKQVYSLPGVNLKEVREYRLKLHNDLRAKWGRQPYKWNYKLEKTARAWSEHMAKLGKWTHARKTSDGFYNYWSIKDWFAKQGVTFDFPGTAFSESVCYNWVNCGQGQDCTSKIKSILKQCFDMFASEYSKYGQSCFKGGNGCAHFRAIIKSYFTDMGMGIATDGHGKYYITTHYGVNVR